MIEKKDITLGDLPVKTLLKHLNTQIKETCSKNDKYQISTYIAVALFNALTDTLKDTYENLKD